MARPDQQPQPESQPDEVPHPQTQIQLSNGSQIDQDSSVVSQTEDHSQVQIVNHSKSLTAETTPITMLQLSVIISVTIRGATWVCLLASLIALAANTCTVNGLYQEVKIGFSNVYAYRYMMSTIVIGFAYISGKLFFEIYQVITGKSLLTVNGLPEIIFYGDKLLLSLLATGVGAAFGATHDLKKNLDALDDALLVFFDNPILSQARSKLDNFFSIAYVSAGFLLFAFLCSIVSSILSSLALRNK